jgi:hypothetical protein
MSNKMDIKEFCKKYNLTEDQFFGREWIEGNLDLSDVLTVPEGFSVKTKGCLNLNSLRSLSEGVSLASGGWMALNSLKTLPPGVSLTSGESLNLNSLTTLSPGVSLTSGESLNLNSLTTLSPGVGLTAGESLNLNSLTTLSEGVSLASGGGLHLNSLKTLSEGVSLASGSCLFLNSLKTLSEGVSLASGGWVILSSLIDIPKDFDPLCRRLVLSKGVDFQRFEIPKDKVFTHKNKKYIDADGILSEAVRQRKNIYKIKIIGHEESSYLVYDGENWSHGSTLRKAYEDLDFKGKVRDLSEYKDYSLATELSFSEAIGCYRAVTGACFQGIKHFVKTKGLERKSYTVKEIISLTKNAYGGGSFKKFFS